MDNFFLCDSILICCTLCKNWYKYTFLIWKNYLFTKFTTNPFSNYPVWLSISFSSPEISTFYPFTSSVSSSNFSLLFLSLWISLNSLNIPRACFFFSLRMSLCPNFENSFTTNSFLKIITPLIWIKVLLSLLIIKFSRKWVSVLAWDFTQCLFSAKILLQCWIFFFSSSMLYSIFINWLFYRRALHSVRYFLRTLCFRDLILSRDYFLREMRIWSLCMLLLSLARAWSLLKWSF